MADSTHNDGHDDPEGCYVALLNEPLDVADVIGRVRSPKAGANVLFSGTTRDNFDGQPVASLVYQAYEARALRTMRAIAADVRARYGLQGIAIVHRLGSVPIGEESILIAVSAAHRQAAWQAGEQCLERVKATAEIWKLEVFEGEGDEGDRVWRANRESLPDGRRIHGGETR